MVGNDAQQGGAVTKATTVDAPALEYPNVLKRIQEILGVPRLRTDQDLMKLVEERLSSRAIDALRQCGLTDEEVYSLVVPRRTLSHRRARREALSRDESDRVVRVARVVALCEEVFGERERGWRWLRNAKRQFQGRAPLDLLATEAGARLVEELLYRIDEGMAA
jgi:putative toxin-antitoxin system antitoxin component (TIGR02293 family)